VKDGNIGKVRLQCKCGHKMRAMKADFLNELKNHSTWRCHKCLSQYHVRIYIDEHINGYYKNGYIIIRQKTL
jgi:hypothetical protein